jgi:DNA-binding SARP family transcriptional activator
MEFRLLGSVEVVAAGRPLEAGPPRQQLVLAALLVGAGQVVGRETLLDRVWGEDPPANARETLRTYLTRIRRLLEIEREAPVELVRRAGGYLLSADPDAVDLHRFRRLVNGDKSSNKGDKGGDEERVTRLREAVALWRGEPLTGLAGDWAARTRDILTQERLDAVTAWARAEIRVGNAEAVIGPLTGLAAEHPLVESLTAALMRALHTAGRSTEALDRCARHRAVLADTHGTDQSAELRDLYAAILRGEVEPPVTRTPEPAQLPADVPAFAGREEHLDRLDEHVGRRPAVAISGTAGVGKTTLAVHWAHRARHAFPDGQFYVNLRGFDPGGQAMDPADALRGFLDALDVSPQRIPVGLDAQAALFRSLLTGRRILVVLDNARDTGQVRPLLPGSPGCLALITSRNQLTGMIAAGTAHPVVLGVLTWEEARRLLAARLGPLRVAAEPDAVDDIIDRCAHLPLALTIVAARAATNPRFPLAALAAELHAGLDVLDGGDPASDVRSVFSWSYRQLSPAAARMFRLLGLHPGPDIGAAMATSLAGRRAGPLLAELARAHLLTEHVPGRYAFHDLLRNYAAELAAETEDADEARLRLLDHAVHSAHTAARGHNSHRDPIVLAPARPGVTPEEPADALTWFTAEHAVLLAVHRMAADHGFDTHTWQLAWTMSDYLDLQGHWLDWVDTQRAAVAATHRLADRRHEAVAHRTLARGSHRLGRTDEAHLHLRHALRLFDELGDQLGQGQVHHALAVLAEGRGDHRQGLDEITRALAVFREIGNRDLEANAVNGIGWFHALLGEHGQALTCCEQALAIQQETGNRYDEGSTWDSLGYIHQRIGDHARAIGCFREALVVFRELGDRLFQGETHTRLGDSHLALGDPAEAEKAWREAVTLFTELGRHDEAEAARARMRKLRVGRLSG